VPVYVKTPDGEVKKTAVTVKVTLDGKVFKSNEKNSTARVNTQRRLKSEAGPCDGSIIWTMNTAFSRF